ncbi:hypothetical protein B0O40_0365 [Ruminococcaceae bacterium R-25]|nr:hypothetical protein B0O40_0365 [Ruminococcaceae bacterium R-25]SUQ11002.1 hypothetical protein SAMN06297423_0365 [Oscillospiraceae bacterium]
MENIKSITSKINRYYSQIDNTTEGGPNTRYKSWEWCHQAFLEKKNKYQNSTDDNSKKQIIEYLSLHLAFYLASWGMYRGSSFLLQRDYKAHIEAIKCILDNKYEILWDYKPSKDNITSASELLFSNDSNNKGLYQRIKESYGSVDNSNDLPTDTLITKILMGTLGCVPAFDRFLKAGIAAYISSCGRTINKYRLTQNIESNNGSTFKALAYLAIDNANEFVSPLGDMYPPMNCVDSYLWEIGYELDIAHILNSNKPQEGKEKKRQEQKKKALLLHAIKLGLCNENSSYDKAYSQILEKNQ